MRRARSRNSLGARYLFLFISRVEKIICFGFKFFLNDMPRLYRFNFKSKISPTLEYGNASIYRHRKIWQTKICHVYIITIPMLDRSTSCGTKL